MQKIRKGVLEYLSQYYLKEDLEKWSTEGLLELKEIIDKTKK